VSIDQTVEIVPLEVICRNIGRWNMSTLGKIEKRKTGRERLLKFLLKRDDPWARTL